MIYVAMVEILTDAKATLILELGKKPGSWAAIGAFFGGIALIALIDMLVPSPGNPHEPPSEDSDNTNLMRMGILTAVAIAVHNFPEGLATFLSALKDPQIGISIAIAVAIHNIPEGIAVSVPIFFATGDKKRAFWLSCLSGLSEPAAALVGFLFLAPFFSNIVYGLLFAAVAGIMIFISIDELLPAARRYGEHHISVYGFITGMMVMAISIVLI